MKEKHCFTQTSQQKPGKAMGKYQQKQYQLGPQGAEKPKQEEASSWGKKKELFKTRTLGKDPKATVTSPDCHSHSRSRVRAPLGAPASEDSAG